MNDTLKVAMGAELGAAKAENEKLRGLLTTAWRLRPDQHYHEDHLQAEQKAWEVETAEVLNAADALSQQPEPTDTYTAVDMATAAAQAFRDGQAAVDPAPAQDEREAFIAAAKHHKVEGLGFNLEATNSGSFRDNETRMLHEGWKLARPTRPAQTEQQPTAVPEGWLIELGFDVLDRPFRFVDSKSHTPTIKVILPACEPDDSSSWDLRDEIARRIGSVLAAPIAQTAPQGKFRMGDLVKKSTGSEWVGRVVGRYSTGQTPEGYAVESEVHAGSVQIYPAKALEAVE